LDNSALLSYNFVNPDFAPLPKSIIRLEGGFFYLAFYNSYGSSISSDLSVIKELISYSSSYSATTSSI